ncbi:MAG: ABC transporter permease [Brevinema sp.]
MKAIFMNELRLYGLSWLGWSVLLLLNITAFLGFNGGAASYGKFEGFFSMLQMPLAWAVIISGARSFARDKELGLYELFFTAPVSLTHIILAKFASLFVFFLIPVLGLLIYPLTASFFINISWMTVISGMFGLILLLSIFCSLAILASSFAQSTLTAIVFGFGIWIVMTLIGSLVPILPAGTLLRSMTEGFSYSLRFNDISNGVFRWDDIIFFIALSLFFLKMSESRVLAQISR